MYPKCMEFLVGLQELNGDIGRNHGKENGASVQNKPIPWRCGERSGNLRKEWKQIDMKLCSL